MRSSVSQLLSTGSGNPKMSFPDYNQESWHHGSILILIRGIGPNKPRSLQKIFERIQRNNNVKIKDSSGNTRDIWVRYVRDHPIENNDWGDFQAHRRLLGLITVGKFESQGELNELCRVHESLKVKYLQTMFDSRCILFAPATSKEKDSENSNSAEIMADIIQPTSGATKLDSAEYKLLSDNNFTLPTILKSRGYFYSENDPCLNLEQNITEFINTLFWILESKRLERSKEKFDKLTLLLAPFEKKDFIGLDMESRNNKKRAMGRVTKNLADLTFQCGLINECLNYYHASCETLRAIGDSLWLGAANEGLCASSAFILYPHLRDTVNFVRNVSLQEASFPNTKNFQRSSDGGQILLNRKNEMKISFDKNKISENPLSASSTSSASSIGSTLSSSSSIGSSLSSSSNEMQDMKSANSTATINGKSLPVNILQPEEITARYREAIINYSKYRNAGIIETEAALKAARICIEQNQNLDVSMFLQNVLYINLNMNEQERVKRFETLKDLYQKIGYNRKAAFCQRLAAWRHISQSNTNPDWAESYRLMLESFPGHKLSLEPIEVLQANQGWPCLQIDLIQQLVGTARRLGQSALATRHMTFLLQTMWKHLSEHERKEMALQLQNLSSQCEGGPVPLVLDNGTVIPPANLTDIPYCLSFVLKDLSPHLKPHKIVISKADHGPFLFTPIHFNSSLDSRSSKKSKDNQVTFLWVRNDLCEITLKLSNPLPFELQVNEMRLLTNGIVFESLPQSVVVQPNSPTTVTLHGTPLEVGELEFLGYSTHTLGVKSNCRFKNMLSRNFPATYKINVISSLPKIDLKTSLPQTATFSCLTNSDNVITSANITLYNGEAQDCMITITNVSNIAIEYLDCFLHSNFDTKIQNKLFTFDLKDLQDKLPIKPNESVTFKLVVYGEADFIGTVSSSTIIGSGITSATPFHEDGPASHSGVNSMVSGLANSLPSRVSSPVRRNNEVNSSFRSSTTNSGTLHSEHSSLAALSIVNGGNQTRQFDAQLRFKYSGADGMTEGFCRTCAISFNVELLPSVQVYNWDVLPAEVPSQFYLVLDVANLTAQEMSLNYTSNKTILIEAKESCRVPIPVERCPLEQVMQDYHKSKENEEIQYPSISTNELDLSEKLCSEHIASLVNLKWSLPAIETNGVASLKGISLSPSMVDLVTVSPLEWEVKIDDVSVQPQSEITCNVGQFITLEVRICNNSSMVLNQVVLSIQFYQDYQNGMQNYSLETRVTMSGPNHIFIPSLDRNEKTCHECSVLFFTPGRFKVDIQCKSQQSHSIITNLANTNDRQKGNNIPTMVTLPDTQHIWKFIPPVEITVN